MKKVLLLEDDEDIREVVNYLLLINNFLVESRDNANDIVPEIIAVKPDVIVMDVRISGADGRAICKSLKQNPDTSGIPVILFSALDQLDQVAKSCSADDYITKPFEMNVMLEKLRNYTCLH